jgi:hypothetical protein
MRPAKPLAAAFALTLLTAAGGAAAQDKAEPIEYRFKDDQMLGTTLSSTMAILKVNLHPGRVMLLRPRVSFVGELLKSVETM